MVTRELSIAGHVVANIPAHLADEIILLSATKAIGSMSDGFKITTEGTATGALSEVRFGLLFLRPYVAER